MDIPDDVLLATQIQLKNLYAEKESKEKFTGKEGRKYKLAGNSIPALEQYFFNVLTTMLTACKVRLTITIERKDWEDRAKGEYLLKDVGYCDITKYELIGKEELIKKIRRNSFPYVARLCESKYRELQMMQNKASKDFYLSKIHKNVIAKGIPHISPTIEKLYSDIGLD
jgi:hypothetical protein